MSYVYIPDEYECHFDLIMDCIKLKGEDIKKLIDEITADTALMEKCLDDKFLAFKLHSKKVRDEYENAVNEAIEKTENVWDKCEEKIKESQPTIDKTNQEITTLLKTVNQLNERLENVSFYKIDKLLELIRKVNSMSDSDKAILKKILNIKDLEESV